MHLDQLPIRTQDYLKVIYDLQEWGGTVSSSGVAEALGQKASTTSEGLKRLAAQGLITHEPYKSIELTDKGHRLAVQMVRRHRLIEMYLCTHVGYSWDEVHDEAEHMEHAVSDLFVERISALLGHPTRDPHGDPIPDAHGVMPAVDIMPLTTVAVGECVTVDRISDHDPELLRYLATHEVTPGARIRVAAKPYPEMVVIELCPTHGETQIEPHPISVAATSADSIQVRADSRQACPTSER